MLRFRWTRASSSHSKILGKLGTIRRRVGHKTPYPSQPKEIDRNFNVRTRPEVLGINSKRNAFPVEENSNNNNNNNAKKETVRKLVKISFVKNENKRRTWEAPVSLGVRRRANKNQKQNRQRPVGGAIGKIVVKQPPSVLDN